MSRRAPELPQRVNVSWKVHHPPTPLNTQSELGTSVVTPAIVIVLPVVVALNVTPPVYDAMSHAYRVILPDTVSACHQAHVTLPTSGAANVISRQSFVTASIVTVYAMAFELASKKTSSDAVGRFPAHGAPPLVVAQWFVASDQFHVHHTQYFAIFYID